MSFPSPVTNPKPQRPIAVNNKVRAAQRTAVFCASQTNRGRVHRDASDRGVASDYGANGCGPGSPRLGRTAGRLQTVRVKLPGTSRGPDKGPSHAPTHLPAPPSTAFPDIAVDSDLPRDSFGWKKGTPKAIKMDLRNKMRVLFSLANLTPQEALGLSRIRGQCTQDRRSAAEGGWAPSWAVLNAGKRKETAGRRYPRTSGDHHPADNCRRSSANRRRLATRPAAKRDLSRLRVNRRWLAESCHR